ncbi:NAD-binding protein [Coprobacillaceae bacterium CR2/5/TPMF4]|nr:NAD-binding protein [Coprobacillaceae bacterium CR2/5/TPMF4]
MFTGKDIFVIGGGFAAAEEAVFLTKYGRKVTIIVREDDFTCAKQVSDQAKQHPKIDIHYNSEIVSVNGTNQTSTSNI